MLGSLFPFRLFHSPIRDFTNITSPLGFGESLEIFSHTAYFTKKKIKFFFKKKVLNFN